MLFALCARAWSFELPPGQTVYFGDVTPLDAREGSPIYVYERRVGEDGGAQIAAHITRDLQGNVIHAESAITDDHYGLSRCDLLVDQLGRSGSLAVEGDALLMTLRDARGERSRTEHAAGPVAAGPSLVGFVVEHLEALEGGEAIALRFASIERLHTYAFRLRLAESDSGERLVEMKARSPLVRAAVGPVRMWFDDQGLITHLQGRVPPKIRSGRRLAPLDARVVYRFEATRYR